MGSLYITRPAKYHYAVSGQTWEVSDLARQVPGIRWAAQHKAYVGRGDAVWAFTSRAETERDYEIWGLRPEHELTEREPVSSGTWPLTDGQRKDVAWLMFRGWDGAILANPPASGKTLVAAVAARSALGTEAHKLIVCSAFLRTNWAKELTKWDLGRALSITSDVDLRATAEAEWWIVSYEGMKLVANLAPKGIIFDEAHALKNPKAQRTKFVHAAGYSPWRCALSATPVWNRRKDIWAVAEAVRPGGLGNFWHFARVYLLAKQGEWGWELNGPDCEDPDYERVTEELKGRMRWFYSRRDEAADEVTGGVQVVRHTIWVETERGQCANTGLRPKTERACDLARSAKADGNGYIIFTYTREHAELFARALNCPFIHGGQPPDTRIAILDNAAVSGGCAATMDSIGMGVNAPWASVVIFADLDWVPTKLIQCYRRTVRHGQTKTVHVYFLALCGSFDEAIISTVIDKLPTFEQLMGDGEASVLGEDLKGLTNDVLAELTTKLHQDGPGEIQEVSNDDS